LPSGKAAQDAHKSLAANGPDATFGECTALRLVYAWLVNVWSLSLPPGIGRRSERVETAHVMSVCLRRDHCSVANDYLCSRRYEETCRRDIGPWADDRLRKLGLADGESRGYATSGDLTATESLRKVCNKLSLVVVEQPCVWDGSPTRQPSRHQRGSTGFQLTRRI